MEKTPCTPCKARLSNPSTHPFPSLSHATLLAHPSYDIWSLGCVLYELCQQHGLPLFEATRHDRLPTHHTKTLLAWGQGQGLAAGKEQGLGLGLELGLLVSGENKDKGSDTRESKLATVADPMARNLLWQVTKYINTPYQHTISTHPNTHPPPTLSTYSTNPH